MSYGISKINPIDLNKPINTIKTKEQILNNIIQDESIEETNNFQNETIPSVYPNAKLDNISEEQRRFIISQNPESSFAICPKCQRSTRRYRLDGRSNWTNSKETGQKVCVNCYQKEWKANRNPNYRPNIRTTQPQYQQGKRIKIILMDGTYQEFDNVRDISIIEEKKIDI